MPPMLPVVIVLGVLLGISESLPETDQIKANSIKQLVAGFIGALFAKKPNQK